MQIIEFCVFTPVPTINQRKSRGKGERVWVWGGFWGYKKGTIDGVAFFLLNRRGPWEEIKNKTKK